jgi:pimeloyl-ACP methyl ester carboxylesterase
MNNQETTLPRQCVDALGIETSYYTAGKPDGRPVLLLHGMSTSADSFREIMNGLADDHWLIAPDLPGFGYSENTAPYTIPHLVEWLAAFIDALALPPVVLLGHSFGGIVATSYALAYSEEVTSLVLVAPAVLVAGNYPEWLRKMGNTLGLMDVGIKLSRVFLARQIRVPFYDASRQPEAIWERRLTDYQLSRASAAAMNAAAAYDIRPRLKKIGHETLVIWGENDPVLPAADAPTVAQLMPKAQLRLISECGHIPVLEHVDKVSGYIRSFLR